MYIYIIYSEPAREPRDKDTTVFLPGRWCRARTRGVSWARLAECTPSPWKMYIYMVIIYSGSDQETRDVDTI